MRRKPQRVLLTAAAVVVMGTVNLATHRSRSRAASTAWSVAGTAGLAAVARMARLSRRDLGLDPRLVAPAAGRGARWAGLAVAVPAALVANPGTRHIFDDDRHRGTSVAEFARTVLIHIPFGTVMFEEFAFRGVIPALLSDDRGDTTSERRADLVSAGLFGL